MLETSFSPAQLELPRTRERRRLTLAIQKSGRLADRSREMLERAGLSFEWRPGRLDCRCPDFPLDVMLVRDDDIPAYVAEGVVDLGIVGENVLAEKLEGGLDDARVSVLERLGFGRCRLAIALPEGAPDVLDGRRIATSYPRTLTRWLAARGIEADVVPISGSVEIAPAMGIADAICDLVSTGQTLQSNGLRELAPVLRSEALLIRSVRELDEACEDALTRLTERMEGVRRAAQAKYVMMNAPLAAVDAIRSVIPGMEEPTVIPLAGSTGKVAVHAVATEQVFWETLERLKALGATSILVLPIEKITG
jgi:ATP phosphoribosyltransferase